MTSTIDTDAELDLSKMVEAVSELAELDEEECLRVAAYADSYPSIDPGEVAAIASNRDIDIYPDTDMSDLAERFVEEGIIDIENENYVDVDSLVRGLESDGWNEVSVDIDQIAADAWEVSTERDEAEEKYEEEYGDDADDEEWLEENPVPVKGKYDTVQEFVEAVQEWQESYENRNEDSDKPTLEEYLASEREDFVDDIVSSLHRAGLRGDCDCVVTPGASAETYDSLLEALNNGEIYANTTLQDYAQELVREGAIDVKRQQYLIDYDAIVRDLEMDYTEFEFGGSNHVYRLP